MPIDRLVDEKSLNQAKSQGETPDPETAKFAVSWHSRLTDLELNGAPQLQPGEAGCCR
jgi:hypothetical protein